ncbi:MAG: uncharacterized protein A8A55_0523 [Amphiamblys sp. WSBS2006]|nr:MAG: uncharacterized protein A8A55_0523 [Amphiamblys sp. WSBS2006]
MEETRRELKEEARAIDGTMEMAIDVLCGIGENLREAGLNAEEKETRKILGLFLAKRDVMKEKREIVSSCFREEKRDGNEVEQMDEVERECSIKKTANRNDKYKTYLQRVADVGDGAISDDLLEDEDGVDVISATTSTRCPLSQREFVSPAKNQACGHVFSYESISEYMRAGHTKCPVSGCSASISTRSLLKDKETQRRMESRGRRVF